MSEFDLVALGDIADIRMGQSPDSNSYTDDDRFMPFLQGCGDFTEEFPETRVFCSNPGKVAPEGSLLVSVRAPVGTTNIADQEYCIGRGLASVKSSVLPAVYLREIFNLSTSFLYRRAQGSTFDAISLQDLRAFPIPVPKKKEKLEHLVAIFESGISEIRATQALIKKNALLKQGMMVDLFSRGIDPATGKLRPSVQDAPELYHDTPLGPMPKTWDIVRAFDIAKEIVVGIVVEPSQYYLSEGVAVFRSANIQENRINEENFVFMSEESNQKNRKSMIRTGDVITVRTGYPGTTCVVPEKYNGANAVDIIITRLKEDVLPHFFSLWVNSDFGKGQVLSAQGGLAQQHFNVGAMKDLLLPKTSMEEQAAILEAASSLLQTITLESNYLGKLKLQKAGLMRDLLTGKVPVSA